MAALVQEALGTYARCHDTVYQRTSGWIGHRMMLLPSLLLHTVGAKTGKTSPTSLTYARGGGAQSPGWYHNLKANRDIEINAGRKRFAVTAQPLLSGDPVREQLWKLVTKYGKTYDEYQKNTGRRFPIVSDSKAELTSCDCQEG